MFGDYVESGASAPLPRERRRNSTRLVGLMEVGQPPGGFSNPAVGLLIVSQSMKPARTSCDIGFNRATAEAAAGLVAVQLPDLPASIVHDLPKALRVASFDMTLLDRLTESRASLETLRRPGLEAIGNRKIGRLVAGMWGEARVSDMASRIFVEVAPLPKVGLLLRSVGAPPRRLRGRLAPRQRRRATAYTTDDLDAEVALEEVGPLIGLSLSHLCTALRQSTELRPHASLVRTRVDWAKALLANPRLRLREIAQAVGYGGHSAVGAAFRRVIGSTPSVWRPEARK